MDIFLKDISKERLQKIATFLVKVFLLVKAKVFHAILKRESR